MNELEAQEAYQAIAGALASVGFGWVVQQVEAALRDGELIPREPAQGLAQQRPALARLRSLLDAVESAYSGPALIAERLIDRTFRIQELGSRSGELARWMSVDDQPAYKATELWPFELYELRDRIAELRRVVSE